MEAAVNEHRTINGDVLSIRHGCHFVFPTPALLLLIDI